MSKQSRFVKSGAVSCRSIPNDGLLLFNADSNKERVLNETGSHIWRTLDEKPCVEDVACALAHEFEVDETVALEDVEQYLKLLQDEQFIVVGDKVTSAPAPLPYSAAPLRLDIALTGKCNLSCKYCFFAEEMEQRPDLPTTQWLRFIDELERCGVRDLCFSGGEVFIRKDLFEIIDAAIDGRMRFSLLSNGGLINETIVKKLSQAKRKKRLNSIQISIDGSKADIHDKLRGEGSFAGAIKAIHILSAADLPVTSRVTIHRHNLEDLPAITKLLLDELKLRSFSTNEAADLGSCRKDEEIKLTTVQRLRAMELLVGLARDYKGRVTAQGGPLALYRIFKEMEAVQKGKAKPRPSMGQLSGCGCPNSHLAVNHDGTVTPCTLLSQEVMGHINELDLSLLWQSSKKRKKLLGRAKMRQADLDYCKGCQWTAFCTGGCPATIFAKCGRLDLPNELQCYKRFIEAVGELPDF